MNIKAANLAVLVSGVGLCIAGFLMLIWPRSQAPLPPELYTVPTTEAELLAAGEALVKRYDCNFCHQTPVPESHPLPRDNCQLCHQEYNRPERLAMPLERVGERRTEEFIRRYLRYPYPIRTQSAERMPDLSLSDVEVETLTRYLLLVARPGLANLPDWRPEREAEPDPNRLSRGAELWNKYACGQCHSLGEHRVVPHYEPGGFPVLMPAVFAPPLDTVFERTRPEWLAPAILDPMKWMPYSGMFETTMTEEEARELAWYVSNAVPLPTDGATWYDVQGVLQRNCAACHYGPDDDAGPASNPEGGAGWIATWGTPGRELDLLTWDAVMLGALDDLGNRRPAVVPYAPNSPLLMHISGRKQPSMPFGADPLQPDEIELVRSWIMSGAPGPNQLAD
jgi:mono/diheme cytochrome c family protein